MTYDEIIAEVYTLTKRPDLVAVTAAAVKSATLKAHMSDYYSKDVYETGVSFDTAGYIQSLDFVSLITNFRTLKYFKRLDSATDTTGKFFDILTPEETIDSYGEAKTDIAYAAGRVLEIRASVEFQYGILGCYVLPIVTPTASYSSWVADLFPYIIIFDATRMVLKGIGLDSQAKEYQSLTAEQYALLKINATTDLGY